MLFNKTLGMQYQGKNNNNNNNNNKLFQVRQLPLIFPTGRAFKENEQLK